ncbi:hypothetical protein K8W59_10460 [Nocardioides rotundus]|uniref:SGNH/GDSL hydrolase family protein n=1 Tax=Nocardioides rotundus TaxID=1774216 RepID=UPI001CBB30D2|nr:GDSL-type esterase/lipase family protein [Nocardioides rotundus]UAL28317.1 hypothetical protein K8W59_10460 [Nocardioides rotundus]
MDVSRRRRRRVAVLAGVLLAASALAGCEKDGTGDGVRIMLVGDSITQGRVGDWTWRYRLARTLEDQGVSFDLVGPEDGVYDERTGDVGADGYRDPDFDTDHAARWGATYADLGPDIADQVEDERAQIVVNALGTNDLLRDGRSPAQVARSAETLVANARSVDARVDVVLVHIPGRTRDAEDLNARLDALADRLDRPDSRVVTGTVPGGYLTDEDLYDGLHPDASGERKIARGVARALAEVGVGASGG